ncbi:hypothetical protein HP572_04165 [Pectobacterium sp. PL64]|uniref:hypothetical protein n=1 Tax=Pectobacterium sp. PL64 TaxID=2738983 RepID=UPI001F0BF554|nr:hypothetical protein [Pectobacterium sp. PL64]UMO88772.1 hypothetical protein HP572_04165 [Pectobacterium sp. PL64]
MKKIFQLVLWISAIATILSFLLQLKTPSNELELKLISRDLLTRPIEVDGLKSSYAYNDQPIQKLWQLRYILTNVGSKSLIGSGDKSSLINQTLTLEHGDDYEVLEYILNSNDFELYTDKKGIHLKFLQWKPKESIEILLYLSQVKGSDEPNLKINEREIIDGSITTSSLISSDTKRKFLYEYLPEYLHFLLKWFTTITFVIILLIIPFIITSTISENRNYKNWCKDYQSLVEDLSKNGSKFPKNIENWSKENWESAGIPKPKIPSDTIREALFISLILGFFLGVPLLFMISV